MAFWIILAVIAFIVGTVMSLQPSTKEKALGRLRDEARNMGLNPRVVPCPKWLINQNSEKGKGMVALYGVVLPEAKLTKFDAQVIDGTLNVVDAQTMENTLLHGEPCDITGALGLTMQANFVGLYWTEKLPKDGKNMAIQTDEKLKKIKEYLQNTAKKVQARRDLSA